MNENEREISLDTETTGLSPKGGDRLVEIGCVELINRIPTGKTYHVYINPERDMPEAAFNVHGLSQEFLSNKSLFKDIANDFLTFIGKDKLIIHNASFDIGFLNHELKSIGQKVIRNTQIFCTLQEARKKFPGSPANLDALCRRFDIDTSKREKHGALLDASLLAEMYLELMGGSQVAMNLSKEESFDSGKHIRKTFLEPREHKPSNDELIAHAKLIESIKEPMWKNIRIAC